MNRPPKHINILFFFSPSKPKSEGIYWCVIEADNGEEKEMQYTYVEFKEKNFILPVNETITFTVKAWAELPNPIELFTEPKKRNLIIPAGNGKIIR